jgi:phosphoserine aminotransferase
MQEIGIKGIIAENRRRSALIYETLDNNRQIETFVKEPNWRSFTVAVIDIRGGSRRLHDELVERDLIPAKGYGSFKDQHLRLANFPSIETESFDSLISHIRSYEG